MLFTDEHGKVLVVDPTYKPRWELPGGMVERGESPADAAVREVQEELGLSVALGPLLALDHVPATDTRTEGLIVVFDGGILPDLDALSLPPEELGAAAFVAPTDLASYLPPLQTRRAHAALHARATETVAYLEDGSPPRTPAAPAATDPQRLPASTPPAAPTDSRAVGQTDTVLVIVRGNSGAGKSSVTAAARARYGRGCALIGQDHLRRILLWERDQPGGFAPDLITHTAAACLDAGRHVIVEGILHAEPCRHALLDLASRHRGTSVAFYLDVPWDETLRRHATRPQATEFHPEDMRGWWAPHDLLRPGTRSGLTEHVLGAEVTLEDATDRVLNALRPSVGQPQPGQPGQPPRPRGAREPS